MNQPLKSSTLTAWRFGPLMILALIFSWLLVNPGQAAESPAAPLLRPALANPIALQQLNLVHWNDSKTPSLAPEDLATQPTQLEGLAMAIRLMGKESEALSATAPHPLDAVPLWGQGYVSYGWQIGLIPADFLCDQPLSQDDYLRLLGYVAKERGLSPFDKGAFTNEARFDRSDLADLTYALLTSTIDGITLCLADQLISEGIISVEAAILADLPVAANTPEAYQLSFSKSLLADSLPFIPTEKNKTLLARWMNDPTSPFVYVNQVHTLAADFLPPLADLGALPSKSSTLSMQPLVLEQLTALFQQAAQDGITLYGRSAYRSYKTQVGLYGTGANPYRAKAGASEHQTGLALDVVNRKNTLSPALATSKEAQWLLKNAPRYGFIIRYPQGQEALTGYPAEWWHLRYVGETIAYDCQSKGLTYDEFYQNCQVTAP